MDENPSRKSELIAEAESKGIVFNEKWQSIAVQVKNEPTVQLEQWPINEKSTILVDMGRLK